MTSIALAAPAKPASPKITSPAPLLYKQYKVSSSAKRGALSVTVHEPRPRTFVLPARGDFNRLAKISPLRCTPRFAYVEYIESYQGTKAQTACATAALVEFARTPKVVQRLQFMCETDGNLRTSDLGEFHHRFHVAFNGRTPRLERGSGFTNPCL